MSSASYYRSEAQRCRDLAAHSVAGSTRADQWLHIAAEYETLAEALERAPLRGKRIGSNRPAIDTMARHLTPGATVIACHSSRISKSPR